jgi:hypothetical protein
MLDLDEPLWSVAECYGTETVGTIRELTDSKQKDRPTLLFLLRKTRSYKSTLPADKIYGLLNLCSDAKETGIKVNYDKDASHLYRELALRHIERHNSLDILYECYRPESESSSLSLPSWVPDWTLQKWHYNWLTHKLPFKASGETALHFQLDGNIIHVKGVLLDTVAAVETIRAIPKSSVLANKEQQQIPMNVKFNSTDVPVTRVESAGRRFWESSHAEYKELRRLNRKEWVANAIAIAFPTGTCTAQEYENLWRTFVLNLTEDNDIPPPSYGQAFIDWTLQVTLPRGELERRATRDKAKRVGLDLRADVMGDDPATNQMFEGLRFGRANSRCYNRRFFRSNSGRYGWGVDGMRAGDLVVALFGTSVPFLLRLSGKDCYEIVGDAYIHGFMFGEGVERDEDGQIFSLI